MNFDLPLGWALMIGFAFTMYAILDGFDLGVGMLLLSVRREEDRDILIRSIAPVWDGNETWLVLVGAGLLGGFPAAYGIHLPAFYLPLIVMLLCLALRGTAFEFRFQVSSRRRWAWDLAFSVGSWGAALCQGIVIGACLQGVAVRDFTFTGSPLDAFSLLSLLTGLAVAGCYLTLGSTWLILRTQPHLAAQFRSRSVAAIFFLAATLALLFVLLPRFAPQAVALAPLASTIPFFAYLALLVGTATLLLRSLRTTAEAQPFALAIAFTLLVESGFVTTVWPYLIPYQLTLWQAASAERSQLVLFLGALIVLPFVIAYSAYSYFVFRGKVAPEPDEFDSALPAPEATQ